MQIAQTHQYSSLLMLYSGNISEDGASEQTLKISALLWDSYHRVPDSSLRVSTLTLPRYVVAMQARTTSDTTLMQQVFNKLREQLQMQVVKDARDAVPIYWKRSQRIYSATG